MPGAGRGLSGLANIGNTCYMNSCLQALSHTPELNRVLEAAARVPARTRKCAETLAVHEWTSLRRLMWKANHTIAPHGFVGALRRIAHAKGIDLGFGIVQNDLQEFLQFLIECFHTSLAREVEMNVVGTPRTDQDRLASVCHTAIKDRYHSDYSEMLPLFHGVHVAAVEGRAGQLYSVKPEPFSVLSLPLPALGQPCSLLHCLKDYCAPCDLTGENQYETDWGEKVDAKRRLFFWSLPRILVVHLKRWGYTGHKDQRPVAAQGTLDMSSFVGGYKPESFQYELYAVCNHMGSAGGGHYTAVVKLEGSQGWYEFNDTTVRRVNSQGVVTPYAYCLFYRKKIIDR